MILEIFILLILFQVKHFLADYLLQTPYMLGKFKEKGWVGPLSDHCLVHAFSTYFIALVFVNPAIAIMLSLFDFAIHFVMDRVKASPNYLGRYSIDNKRFWWSLGFDQMVHHLTHYAIIGFITYRMLLV